MIKIREFKDKNYRSIYFKGKTMRQRFDESKEIEKLDYPEFLDVKLTSKCEGSCQFCYMDSKPEDENYSNALTNIKKFFGAMTENQKPFQLAYGGGEPTLHPDFHEIMKTTFEMGITPNYTTNGMHITNEIIETTKKYCGGVAVSCHPHLDEHWRKASQMFIDNGIMLNFHIIISDKTSVDRLLSIYEEYKDKVDYFVLLPHMVQGRAKETQLDFDYLFEKLDELDSKQIAFGANFYPWIKDTPKRYDISIYEPEIMSGFLDLKDMKIYKSSFHLEEVKNEKLDSLK